MRGETTTGIVLATAPAGEFDTIVSLFTEAQGKIEARATSSRKITSKLAGHLQPLHIVRIRLTHKNGFRAADALTIRIAPKTTRALELLDFINTMAAPLSPDRKLWLAVKKALEYPNNPACYPLLLTALGFDMRFAECGCGSKQVKYFSRESHGFRCARCALGLPQKENLVEI
ncbi:recombination protein O N-terminal domain-containing protein [Candidatus Wolfebacteria bacterium]|nr:recombination protein O N-terminal domain-containing protein [Candidatus Wolfebacteria bacterium]